MHPLARGLSTALVLLMPACVPGPNQPMAPVRPVALRGEVDTIIPVEIGKPYGVAVSSRGLAYVTIWGARNGLASYDFGSRRYVSAAVRTGQVPTNVAFSPNGLHAYVASQYSYRIDRVDVRRGQIDSLWHTPANHPFQVAVSPDGRRVYATGNAEYLYAFDAPTGQTRGVVHVANAPNGIAFSRGGDRVYITHLRSRELGVVDIRRHTYQVLAQLDAIEGQGVVVSEDGTTVYALSEVAGRLYAIDAVTGDRRAQATTATKPFGLALTPDGSELWVTTLTGVLQRFRASDLAPVGELHVGGRLRRMGFDPLGRGAVIADEEGRIILLR